MVCLSRAESAFDDSWGRNGARNLCALISPYYNISTSSMVKPVT